MRNQGVETVGGVRNARTDLIGQCDVVNRVHREVQYQSVFATESGTLGTGVFVFAGFRSQDVKAVIRIGFTATDRSVDMRGIKLVNHELQNSGAVTTMHVRIGVLVSLGFLRIDNLKSILVVGIAPTDMIRDIADFFRIHIKLQRDNTVATAGGGERVHVNASC